MAGNSTHFAFACSYMGCTWFSVFFNGQSGEVCLRRELGAYERSTLNGGPEGDYAREVESTIGVLTQSAGLNGHGNALPAGLVEAFNAWRLAEHAAFVASMDSQPERYGLGPNDPIRIPPCLARAAGHYDLGKGWIFQPVIREAA